MSTVAARAASHLRTHGLGSTLRRAGPALRLALYLHEYHRWEQLLLVEDRPHPPLADGLRFRLGDESDLALLSMPPSIHADDALDLLAQGTRWCLVLDDQGVVFTTWIYHGRAPAVAAPGGWFSLPDGVACQEGSLTATRARGLGIAPAAWARIGDELADAGDRWLVRKTEATNASSIRAGEKAGFKPFATMHSRRLGPWRRLQLDGDGENAQWLSAELAR
jgi:GNAT superfamily N-acetyltransferase